MAFARSETTSWQLRLGLILIPAAVYIVLMLRERFPATENQASGVSTGEMFAATFTSPLFLLMLATMFITASIELGPGRWIPAVLQSGGLPGILVLVWISGLMAVLRMNGVGPAHPCALADGHPVRLDGPHDDRAVPAQHRAVGDVGVPRRDGLRVR